MPKIGIDTEALMKEKTRESFTGSFGFVLATASSAIGLGNLWRFPYLAAKDGGGLFLCIYLLLVVTFGFTLMGTELAMGRRTECSALLSYGRMDARFGFVGWPATIAAVLILSYYCVIGGWIIRYALTYLTGNTSALYSGGSEAFLNSFLNDPVRLLLCFTAFCGASAAFVAFGVKKGIEGSSKVIMPILLLLILSLAGYTLTLSYTDADGVTRTAWEGLRFYLVPRFDGLTPKKLLTILMDAVGQLFYSLGIAMGVLITYGSYAKKDSDLARSIGQIELFDTGVALMSGAVIIPAVFVFQGYEGLARSGPGLMFVSLPAVFEQMGVWGNVIGAMFFVLCLFAALTSSISIMESVTASLIDRFALARRTALTMVFGISCLLGAFICLGYNLLAWSVPLPGGDRGRLLDLVDAVSNNFLLPVVGLLTCILVGWVTKPRSVLEELGRGRNGVLRREKLFAVMIKWVCPILLLIILLEAFGLLAWL